MADPQAAAPPAPSGRRRALALAAVAVLLAAGAATALRGPEPERRVATQVRGDARMDGVVSERTPTAPDGVVWTARLDTADAGEGGGRVNAGVFAGGDGWVALAHEPDLVTTVGTGQEGGTIAQRSILFGGWAGDLAGGLLLSREGGAVVARRLPELDEAWRATVVAPDPSFPRVEVLSGDPVVLQALDGLVALDATDGSVVWERRGERVASDQFRPSFGVTATGTRGPFGLARDAPLVAVPAEVDGRATTEVLDAATGAVTAVLPYAVQPGHAEVDDSGTLHVAHDRSGPTDPDAGFSGVVDTVERWVPVEGGALERDARATLAAPRELWQLFAMPGGWAAAYSDDGVLAVDGDEVAWEYGLDGRRWPVPDGDTLIVVEDAAEPDVRGVPQRVAAGRLDRRGRDVLDPDEAGRPTDEVRADGAGDARPSWVSTQLEAVHGGLVVSRDGWSQAVPSGLGSVAVTDGSTVVLARADGAAAFGRDGTPLWTRSDEAPDDDGGSFAFDQSRQRTSLAIEPPVDDEAAAVVVLPTRLPPSRLGLTSGLTEGPAPKVGGLNPPVLAVADDLVVTGSSGVVRVDPAGDEVLSLAVPGGRAARVAVVDGGDVQHVVVTHGSGVAQHQVGGEDWTWERDDLEPCAGPVVASHGAPDEDATVLVALADGTVAALSATSGDARWMSEGEPPSSPLPRSPGAAVDPGQVGVRLPLDAIPAGQRLAACPVLLPHGDVVHVVGASGVTTLARAAGEVVGTRDLPAEPSTLPVRAGDRVLYATLDDELVGVDLTDGDAWQVDLPSPAVGSPVVLDDDTIVVPTVEGLAALR